MNHERPFGSSQDVTKIDSTCILNVIIHNSDTSGAKIT